MYKRQRQWAEGEGLGRPVYAAIAEGPSHDVTFTATVSVDGTLLATGQGRSKKAAEVQAACAALEDHDDA